jgi:hypothetical protein
MSRQNNNSFLKHTDVTILSLDLEITLRPILIWAENYLVLRSVCFDSVKSSSNCSAPAAQPNVANSIHSLFPLHIVCYRFSGYVT